MNNQDKNTEQLILEAAVKEFEAKGIDGARTTSIAKAAGVTHTMLHYYFRTKEKLFEQIFKDKIGFLMGMLLKPIDESKGNFREKILEVVERHFDFLMANREMPAFFITAMNARPEMFKEIHSDFYEKASELVGSLQKEAGDLIDVRDLLSDIASLNLMPFVATPIMMSVLGYKDEDKFLLDRKKENIEVIRRRLS